MGLEITVPGMACLARCQFMSTTQGTVSRIDQGYADNLPEEDLGQSSSMSVFFSTANLTLASESMTVIYPFS